MKKLRLTAIFLSLLLIVSCAALQTTEYPIESYGKALGIWTDCATQFKFYYERTDEETKARWDKEYRPLLLKSKEVLDLWKIHLDAGQSTEAEMDMWKQLKNELILYLATNMGG